VTIPPAEAVNPTGNSSTHAQVLSPATHLEFVAIEVAVLAAEFVRTQHGSARAAGTKSTPTDVVTETDLASETLIRNEIAARCPGSTVIGEEYDDTIGANTISWIVDPIDGTVNFLYGLPVVSISVAARIGGETVAGAVTDLLSGNTFSATASGGARLNGAPLQTSQPASLATSLIGTGFAYQANVRSEQAETLTRLLPACRDIRCMGSAALNLCWVGAGLLDGYFERDIKLYDYAAGELIAREAGAVVRLPAESGNGLAFAASAAIAGELFELVNS